ncbi:MAG: ABC transporter permease [Thaumarchaeota archaeon]|nr:ABC transporter permease [Nitrososphaerota archaeon]
MRLYEYVVRRLILMVFVLFVVSVIVFYLTRGILPATFALAPYITPRMNDATKLGLAVALGVATPSCPSWSAFGQAAHGCIVPLYQQYFSWLQNVFSGNWGYSLLPDIGSGQTTLQLFSSRFPATAELAIAGSILTVVIALPMGIISATRNNKLPDHVSRIVALTGYSMPVFWLAFILQIAFVLYLRVNNSGILPSNGLLSTTCGICLGNVGTVNAVTGAPIFDAIIAGNPGYFWDSIVALALPAITLSFSTLGALTRIVRSSMMECLRQDYILLARSKGLAERTVIYRHALKNALLPAITISGIILASLLGGVVVVEYVFSWPGIGIAALSASLYVDINFLELYTLVIALIIVLSNLGVDVLYAFLDPRIRF